MSYDSQTSTSLINKLRKDRGEIHGPVMRAISRSDFFFRLCKRRILPIMSMVITPRPLLHKNAAG